MNAKKNNIKSMERSLFRNYLKKASEFYELMLKSQEMKKWNAAGLNAVHCAISAADALLVFYSGVRSSGADHKAVISLLINSVRLPEIGAKSETLRKILAKKNIIEYEDRDFQQKESLEIIKLTDRFYKWTVSKLG